MPVNKNTNEWGQLSMKDRADLIAIYTKHGYTSIDDIRKDYESNRERFINSDANFVQRLRNEDTRSIIDENGENATHKMSWVTGDNQATIYPSIQESEGRLVNREKEKLGGYYSAAENGDTVNVSKPFAEYYEPRYKRDFQGFFEKFVPQKKTVDDMNEELIYDNRREDNNILAPGGRLDGGDILDGTQEQYGADIDWYDLQNKYPSIYKKFRPKKPGFLSIKDMAYNVGVNSQGSAYVDTKDIMDYALKNDKYVPTIYAYIYGPDKVYNRFNGKSNGFDYSDYLKKTGYKNVKEYNGLFNENNEFYINPKNRGLIEELAKNGAHIYSQDYLDSGYHDDVNSYIHKFGFDKDGNIVVSDSDIYDFYRDFNTTPLHSIEYKLMEKIGNPYILRQDNIPVKYDDTYTDSLNYELDNLYDEEIARLTNSGYIEPAIVSNKFGGKVNRFDDGGNTYNGGNINESKVSTELSRNQWNDLYKRRKVKLSDIPRKYQQWIEAENSGIKEVVKEGTNKDFKFVGTALVSSAALPVALMASPYLLSSAIPYLTPGTAEGITTTKLVSSILGGEVINKAVSQTSKYNSVGEAVRDAVKNTTGFDGFNGDNIGSQLGNAAYTIATDSVNPGYWLPWDKMTKTVFDTSKYVTKSVGNAVNDYKLVKSAKSEGIATKEIPFNENNYYRHGNENMIEDANVSGVVRSNQNSYIGDKNVSGLRARKWAGASFKKGKLFDNSKGVDGYVIEGFDRPELEWVVKSPDFEMKHFVEDTNANALRKNIYEPGVSEFTPLYFGNVDIAPSEYFKYYKRGNGLFSKKYWFKNNFEEPLSFRELTETGRFPTFSTSEVPVNARDYGNMTNNVYGELKLIRNISGLPKEISPDMVYASNPESAIANFTYDLPFRTHKKYSTIPGLEYMVVDPAAFKGQTPISINPMDVMFKNSDIGIPKKYVQILSGDKELIKQAQNAGYRVITSPKLMKLHKQIQKESKDVALKKAGKLNLEKTGLVNQESISLYKEEIDRLFSSVIGRPSLDDVKYLEKVTGLNSGVEPAKSGIRRAMEYNDYIDSMIKERINRDYIDFKYGDNNKINGFTQVAKKQHIPVDIYHNIFYNPVPTIEYDILKKYGISPHPKKYDVFNERFNTYTNGLNPIEYDIIADDIGANPIVVNKFKD